LRTKKNNEYEFMLEGSFDEAISPGTDSDPIEDTVTTDDYIDARWRRGSLLVKMAHCWNSVGVFISLKV
jgi:hypothetical protein